MSLDSRILKNNLQIREAKVSESKFMRTFSESKSIFQKAIVSCFIKNVAFLFEHPVHRICVHLNQLKVALIQVLI